MIRLMVDGQDWSSKISGVRTMPELVELVKANIDPEKIVTAMAINGQNLTDADWRAPLVVQGESQMEILTGSKESYVQDRLGVAISVVEEIIEEFHRARSLYQDGVSREGNMSFSKAVGDLRAFFNWYFSVLDLANTKAESQKETFKSQVSEISSVCEQMLQQQMYQSWWALGQTLEAKLEPQLGTLKTSCATFADSYQQASTIQ